MQPAVGAGEKDQVVGGRVLAVMKGTRAGLRGVGMDGVVFLGWRGKGL
jgi:hypothetical protein